MTAPTERPREVWEQVLDELRMQIVLGELEPGERLVETELAHQFGVSRGPVRTALMTLEKSGLVSASSRRGVEVARFSPTDIAELYDVRTALEVLAVRHAAPRVTATLTARLTAHLDELDAHRAAAQYFDAAESDLAFHHEICAASGNRLLLVTWSNLADQVEVVMARVFRSSRTPMTDNGAHRAVLEALTDQDPDAAETAMRRHLDIARAAYLDLPAASELPATSAGG